MVACRCSCSYISVFRVELLFGIGVTGYRGTVCLGIVIAWAVIIAASIVSWAFAE